MDDLRFWVALAGLAVVLIGHLIGFIWWAATLTSRVGTIEKWIDSNRDLHAEMIGLRAQIATLTAGIDSIRSNVQRLYDKLDNKVDKP